MKKFILLALAFCTVTAFGQTETSVIDTIDLETIEVTGVRADDKTPITQKTIKGEEIKANYQGQEMVFILDKTPSMTSSTDGGHAQGYTYFRLRGIDQTRINMTLNGVPLNEPEDQGVYFSNYPGFANNIASMQIQRGVGTSSNGVASYAGSINFESPTGLKQGASMETTMGSFNTTRFSSTISTGMIPNSKVAMYMNFSTYGTDGYKYNSGGIGHSFFLSGGYYGDKHVIKFTGFSGHSWNHMAWFAVSEDDIANDPRTNYNTPDERDDFTQSFAQVQHTTRVGKSATVSTTAYYNRLDGNWDLDLAGFGAGTDVLNYQLASNFYGILSNFKYVSNDLTLNVGVHGNMYERDHAMAIKPDVSTTLYNNTGFKNEMSGYVKGSYDAGKVTLFGDVQYRYVTFRYDGAVSMPNIDWTFLNPKAGIMYRLDNKNKFYASVGQAHREPTRTNMFGGEDDLVTFTGITPESVVDVEAGYNFRGTKLNVNTNLYYMDFKNEITLIGALGANGLPLMTNVENSFRSGIELDIQYKVNDKLSFDNNTSYSYNRITDNGNKFQPLYTPNLIINQVITYSPWKFLSVSVNAKYHSESYIDFGNEFVTPEFVVLGVNTTFTYQKLSFKLQVNNLTNQQYFTNGYAIGDTRYFFMNAPTNVYGTLAFNF